MKRIAVTLVALCLVSCTSPRGLKPAPSAAPPAPEPVQVTPPSAQESPDLAWVSTPRAMTRDQIADGLIQLMNGPGTDIVGKLQAVYKPLGFRTYDTEALPYAVADLDGDGGQDYVMAMALTDPTRAMTHSGTGAALFVIHKKNGRWEVDRSNPMSELAEISLMGPALHAVADVAGTGRPQIIWSRPQLMASGLQPTSFFVTTWKPGSFTNLPGDMAISRGLKEPSVMVTNEKDLVLTGSSRRQAFVGPRTDRYHYVDGAFRLVDRRFVDSRDLGYDRFWEGAVAEAVGRVGDAERNYREAADPSRTPQAGAIPRYMQPMIEMSPAQMDAFGQALRTLARFRLGALLKAANRESEAAAVLKPDGGPYAGLLAAMQQAPTRTAGCQAASAWAEGHPDFLAAFNQGVANQPWAPGHLCKHVPLEDALGVGEP